LGQVFDSEDRRLIRIVVVNIHDPALGTERLEEFLDHQWGDRASRTYAKNLSVLRGFFKWAVLSKRMYGDPAMPIRPPKKRGVHRETLSDDERAQILAAGPDPSYLFREPLCAASPPELRPPEGLSAAGAV
jgi:site-specific recombinase XerD